MAAAGPTDAYLSARDPVDEGDPIDPTDKDTLFIGLLRLHIANLIKPLGHAELSGALHRLTHQPFARRLQDDLNHARTLLDAAPVRELEKASSVGCYSACKFGSDSLLVQRSACRGWHSG